MRMVKEAKVGNVTAAIGDGGNDISMIQEQWCVGYCMRSSRVGQWKKLTDNPSFSTRTGFWFGFEPVGAPSSVCLSVCQSVFPLHCLSLLLLMQQLTHQHGPGGARRTRHNWTRGERRRQGRGLCLHQGPLFIGYVHDRSHGSKIETGLK